MVTKKRVVQLCGFCAVYVAIDFAVRAAQNPAPSAAANAQRGLVERVKSLEALALPVGTILPFAASQVPPGFLVCDGKSYSKQEYPELAALLGTTWGAGDDASFSVPELRGEFLRGADDMATAAGAREISPESRLGKYQEDAFKVHSHTCVDVYHIKGTIGPLQPMPPPYTNNALIAGFPYGYYGDAKGAIKNTEGEPVSPHPRPFQGGFEMGSDARGRPLDMRMAVTSSVGVNETRPRNASVLFIIKAR